MSLYTHKDVDGDVDGAKTRTVGPSFCSLQSMLFCLALSCTTRCKHGGEQHPEVTTIRSFSYHLFLATLTQGGDHIFPPPNLPTPFSSLVQKKTCIKGKKLFYLFWF